MIMLLGKKNTRTIASRPFNFEDKVRRTQYTEALRGDIRRSNFEKTNLEGKNQKNPSMQKIDGFLSLLLVISIPLLIIISQLV